MATTATKSLAAIFFAAMASFAGACTGLARAEDLFAYLTDGAMKDYMLNCAGCHRFDGKGAERLGIPDFRDSIGVFTHLERGRQYMIRVPGAAQSRLSDERLAQVLNWIVARYDTGHAAQPYAPFTAEEVGKVRTQRYDDVARERRELTRELESMGMRLAPYTYGVGNGQAGTAP